MKLLKLISHPVLVCITFSVILISGDHFGGVYLLYLLMALPHGGPHAVLAFIGAAVILITYGRYRRQSRYLVDPLLNILGVFLLYASLWVFFFRSWEENDGTFDQAVPIISLAVFALSSLSLLTYSSLQLSRSRV